MRHGGAVNAAIRSVLDGLLALPPTLLQRLVALGHAASTWALALPLAAIALPLVWRELVEQDAETVAATSLPTFLRERAPSLVRVFRDVMILALLFEAALSFNRVGREARQLGSADRVRTAMDARCTLDDEDFGSGAHFAVVGPLRLRQ